jgi:UDP-N-acetylglucosamine 2-epimerase (non-hydrolysing)/UDP-GlcNAc3NAcA epimerase
MKICSIVGARPQFVKAAVVSRALRKVAREVLIHTGQHYDDAMSARFFRELEIPQPDYDLEVGSHSHGVQTGLMLERIEEVLEKETPEMVLVYGDTNSTLAGAMAAAKLQISVGHVEAGLRSFNRRMPEEINRVLTDHISTLLFCPTDTAVVNLRKEGITEGVFMTGDVMYDALKFYLEKVAADEVLENRGLKRGGYLLLTVHRAESTDAPARLTAIAQALSAIKEKIFFPAHPRTLKALERNGISLGENVIKADPVGYLEMLSLESRARMILTDSGGVQKEAYLLGVPCVTLRDETEWVETVEAGWNILTGADREKIVETVRTFRPPPARPDLFGDGAAAFKIAGLITSSTR